MTGAWPALFRAEWRKVATTKMLWVLILISMVYSVVNSAAAVYVVSQPMPGSPLAIDSDLLLEPDYITTLIATAGGASIFVLILGILGITSEYRHMTITSTFLATPRRGRVIAAKGVMYAAFGALAALANLAVVLVTLAVAFVVLGRDHAPITMESVLAVLVGTVLGLALYGVLGISIGALIRSQVVAIVVAVVWVLLAEALVSLAYPEVGKWLPGGALSGAMQVRFGETFERSTLLPAWGGALVLLGYAVVLGAIALGTTTRRDIT